MTVVPLQPYTPLRPDVGAAPDAPPAAAGDASLFSRFVDELGGALSSAQTAEDRFAAGAGSLQQAVYERARADVVLAVATTAASRCAQATQSLLNMQL